MIKDQVQKDVQRLIEELPEDQKEVLTMRINKSTNKIKSPEKSGPSC